MRRASEKNYALMGIVALLAIATIGLGVSLSNMVGIGTVACGVGIIALIVGLFVTYFDASDFVNRHFGRFIIWSSIVAVISAITVGIAKGKLLIAACAVVFTVLVVVNCFAKVRWMQTLVAVAAILAFILMVLPVHSKEADVQVNVSTEDTNPVDDTRISELTSENESLKADLEEALQANEALRQFLGEHMKRCNGCPICNGTVDGKEADGTRKSGTINGKGTTLPISGSPLGDGNGNGAGLVPVQPVYDVNVPAPGSNEPVKVVTPVQTVDFSNGDNDDVVKVDDNHGSSNETQPESEAPVVETTAPAVTEKLTYSIKGNVITVTAPNGFKAVEEPLYYLVAKGNVTVNSATVQGNILTITFEAAENAELKVCQGMFRKSDIKSEELVISVQRTKVEETEESTEESSEESTEESTEVKNPEMKVSGVNVSVICDSAYEGSALQYVVTADGENIDYSKFTVSAGTISADGTWTIIAPAESGSATISFGGVSKEVRFTVLEVESTEESKEDETSAEETEESTENQEPADEPTVPSEEEPSEESTEAPEVKGTLTSVAMYDSSVVCGSDIQGEISFDGNVNWDEVEVSGLNGLSWEVANGTITIHTSEIASNYEISVSYNGSTVSTSFSVEGVENSDIVWE